MSHGLVYHYFRSKEEIYYELLERAANLLSQSLVMIEKMPLTPLEKVRFIAHFILAGMESHEDFAYFFLIITHASVMDVPDNLRKLKDVSNTVLQTFAKILSVGQKSGEITEGDTLEMTLVFFASIQGLAIYNLSMANFEMPHSEILINMVRKT